MKGFYSVLYLDFSLCPSQCSYTLRLSVWIISHQFSVEKFPSPRSTIHKDLLPWEIRREVGAMLVMPSSLPPSLLTLATCYTNNHRVQACTMYLSQTGQGQISIY